MTDTASMIRVDQAGEYGATRIYAGQLAVMGDRAPHSAEVRAMAEQEVGHQAEFDAMMARRGVRPTALQPVWSVAGYALGAATALLGPETAMACTAAVEEEIDRHYTRQLDRLANDGCDPELAEVIPCSMPRFGWDAARRSAFRRGFEPEQGVPPARFIEYSRARAPNQCCAA